MTVGAVYKCLLSVDARASGGYLDGAKKRMRAQIYTLARGAFAAAGVGQAMVHMEDRGDGFIAAVDARVPPVQLVGRWLAEVHDRQRRENEHLARRLGLRVAIHVGPVEHDDEGLSGAAMDFVCRLADSQTARDVLERSGRDLVCVVSDSLYHDVVRHGGHFVEPSAYLAGRVELKEGPATAWFHVPGEPRPPVPGAEPGTRVPDEEEREGAPAAPPGGGKGPGAAAKAAPPHPDPSPARPRGEPAQPRREPAPYAAGDTLLEGELAASDGGVHMHPGGDAYHIDRPVFHGPAQIGGHGREPRREEDR
jgi:hypothetical protein